MSPPTPQTIVLSIGDELTTGQVVDSNSAFLSARLGEQGIHTLAHWTVSDDRAAIAAAIRQASQRATVVIVTGGLGPTPDDLTREGLADAMEVDLQTDEQALADIEAFFRQRGRAISPTNRRQALCPAGARLLPNALGTAPGIAATVGAAKVYCLPGVPHEMRGMYDRHLRPELTGAGAAVCRVVQVFGVGESDVGAAMADLMVSGRDVRVGTAVGAGLISVRIWAQAPDRPAAEARAAEVAEEIKRRLGNSVVGEDDAALEIAVNDLLRRRGHRLATAESCTGGYVAGLLTSISGAGDVYLGGVVAYSNQVKQAMLEVPEDLLVAHGAVSEPVAAAMAEGCRRRFGADWALATTGIAGPTGGTAEKPVGLVFTAVAGPEATTVQRHLLLGTREIVRLRAARTVLNELRLRLMGAR